MNLLEKVQSKWQDIDVSNCDELFKDTLEKVVVKILLTVCVVFRCGSGHLPF